MSHCALATLLPCLPSGLCWFVPAPPHPHPSMALKCTRELVPWPLQMNVNEKGSCGGQEEAGKRRMQGLPGPVVLLLLHLLGSDLDL